MLNNLFQVNMNSVNAAGNVKSGSIFPQNMQDGQNLAEAGSFIAILAAIFSGLNNAMMSADSGLFANKDGQPVNGSEFLKGMSVESSGQSLTDENIMSIIQQMTASALNAQTAILPQPLVFSNDSRQSASSPTPSPARGEGAHIIPFPQGEVGKGKMHANGNGNYLLQDFKTSFVEDQVSSLKNNIQEIRGLSKDGIANNAAVEQLKQFKVAAPLSNIEGGDKDLKMQIKVSIGAENNAAVMKVGDVGTDMDAGEKSFSSGNNNKEMPAGVTHVQHAASNKGETVVKEMVHASRLNEISEPIMKTLGAGDKHLIIRLEPPDLGSIHIKLRIDNSGVLRADFRVDSNVVRDLFSAAMPQIKASLENSGIKVSDFFVDVKEDYYSDSGKRQQQEDANQHQQKQNKQQKHRFFDYFA